MNFQLFGDSDCPVAHIDLVRGEQVRIETGSMVFSRDVTIEGHMNSNKRGVMGALSALGRAVSSGENLFITTATGESDRGEIVIAPAIPGKIVKLTCHGAQHYRLNTGAFLACDMGMGYNMVRQNIGKAIFGGTGGLFVMETYGDGTMLASAFGDLMPIDVTPERPVTIDNEHVVAWDAALDYTIRVASGVFGFKTGEGLVNDFTGMGRVYIQTRNLRNLAQAIYPYLPHPNNN